MFDKKHLLMIAAIGGMVMPLTMMAQPGGPGKPNHNQPPFAQQPPKPGPQQPPKPVVQPPKPGPQQPPKPVVQPPKPGPQQPTKPVVQPPHVKPAPQIPKPGPQQPPMGEYRPGHKNHPLQAPRERDFYRDWKPLHHKAFSKLTEAPERLQVSMRVGQEVKIKLEEKIGDGLRWFARYNVHILDVDVEHGGGHWYKFSRTAFSEVEIEADHRGDTMVELVYARHEECNRGEPPQKVVQIFVHIE